MYKASKGLIWNQVESYLDDETSITSMESV